MCIRQSIQVFQNLRFPPQDVSWLLDLCRQHIIFEKIEDLLECVRLILIDPDVVVVRVKNRLALDYDARVNAGYRDLCLNLRIVCDTSIRLGVDSHVCEIQLVLLPMASIKVRIIPDA